MHKNGDIDQQMYIKETKKETRRKQGNVVWFFDPCP